MERNLTIAWFIWGVLMICSVLMSNHGDVLGSILCTATAGTVIFFNG